MLSATVHPCWSLTRVFGANRLNRAVDTALQEAVEGAQSPGLGSSSLKPGPGSCLRPFGERRTGERRSALLALHGVAGMPCLLDLS